MDQQKFFNILEQNGITAEKAAWLICRLNSLFEAMKEKNNYPDNVDTVPLNSEEVLSQKVTRLLTNLGFSSNLLGFNYLRKCIIHCVINGTQISLSKTLYPFIAQELETTPERLQRSIRYSIDKVFTCHNSNLIEIMGETINSRKGNPSNSEFIAFVADRIRNNLL